VNSGAKVKRKEKKDFAALIATILRIKHITAKITIIPDNILVLR
jgi:hypothetical protein